MKFNFKYILIICIAFSLFVKVGNVMSYFKFSSSYITYAAVSDDNAEKEEKKVETEVLDNHLFITTFIHISSKSTKKIIIPDNFLLLAYAPEVLTPPPSV